MSLLFSLCKTSARSPVRVLSTRRALSSHTHPRTHTFNRNAAARISTIGVASGSIIAATLWYSTAGSPLHADARPLGEQKDSHECSPAPLSTLLRSYVVYTMCAIPALVDYSPTILSTLFSVPGLKHLTEMFVRITFFNQFVGSETAEGALPLLEQYRSENKGCLFAYSVEVNENEAAGKGSEKVAKQPVYKQIIQEMIHSIDVAADFEDSHLPAGSTQGRRTWVAVKLSALLPHHESLIHFSKYLVAHRPKISIPFPGTPDNSDLDVLYSPAHAARSALTPEDVTDLKDLYADLNAICQRAHERGVRIIIDAEHSWYQPAIDAFAHALMVKFNKLPESSSKSITPQVQPLIYNTYQAYLRRTPAHLEHSLKLAKASGYALGVKLVRGAYHSQEIAIHAAGLVAKKDGKPNTSLSISPDLLPPVWNVKPETDECYNACSRFIIGEIAGDIAKSDSPGHRLSFGSLFGSEKPVATRVPTAGILFGTHNWNSCKLILDELVECGLASSEGKTSEGESIIGIGDAVTERITMAQLYGMHDSLTNYLVDRTRSSAPFVIKYVPYGSLTEVLPYLSRRAIENKSVLNDGAAAEERKRAWAEIRKRIFG